MAERTTADTDTEKSRSDSELKCKLKSLKRRFEAYVDQERRRRGSLTADELRTLVERAQPKLTREIQVLRVIRSISAQQNASGPVTRPRDVGRHPSGSALVEPRGTWRMFRAV